MHYIQQFGLWRSATCFTHWVIETNFKDVNVVWGGKHEPPVGAFEVEPKTIKKYKENGLTLQELENLKEMAAAGKLKYIFTFKNPYS
jgi:hypothetical protein